MTPRGWVTIGNQTVGYGFREEIKKALTIVGRSTSSFQESAPVITLFSEGEETFSIPRGYYNLFLRRRGVEASFRYSEGDNFVVPAEPIDLRPAQKPVVQKVVEYLGSLPFSGAILNINTGGGKTVCGLEIARRMNRKTLVVCPTSVLLDMWIKEAKKFFPQWRVGVLRADKIDIKDKDIVVGTIQSESIKDISWYSKSEDPHEQADGFLHSLKSFPHSLHRQSPQRMSESHLF